MANSVLAEEQKTPRKAWVILFVTYLASVIAPMVQFKVPPLSSWLIPAYGMDGVTFGLCMSAVTIIGVILAFPTAFIVRRLGLKATVLTSVACLCVGCLVGGMVDSLSLFMASRMIEGIGIGLVGVAAPTCVSVWFPEKTRGLALGIWATWVPLGIIAAFNLSPVLAAGMGYKAVFMIMAALCAVVFVAFAMVFKLPEGVTNESVAAQGGVGENLALLKNPRIWVLGFIFFFFNAFTVGVVGSFYNTWMEVELGFDPQFASFLSGMIYIFPLFCAPISGAISDKLPVNKKPVLIMITMVILIVDVFFFMKTGDNQMFLIWFFIILSGVTGGFAAGTCRPLAPIVMGGTAMGAAMGMAVLQFMQNLGTALASPIFGAMYQTMGWHEAAVAFGLPCAIIPLLLAFFIFPRKKDEEGLEGVGEIE